MRLLCIGDSNTFGYDPRSYTGSGYPADVRWTGRLEGHQAVNCGINGLAVPADHNAFAAVIGREEPDLVIVMLGTNDLLAGSDAARTASRMEHFLTALAGTGKQILLIAPPCLRPGAWVQDEKQIQESRKLGKLYRELAERAGCLFADAGEWDIGLAFDGVHLTPAGHAEFARRLADILAKADHKGQR